MTGSVTSRIAAAGCRGKVVDWHAHWVPPELVAFLAARQAAPFVREDRDGRWFHPAPGLRQPVKEHQLDIDGRLAEMDRCGVDRQVLSLAVVLGTFLGSLPADLEEDLVAANNRGLARLVRQRGDRFSGLAALPIGHPERMAEVLEVAVNEQGLLGAILPAEAFASRRSAEAYAALFDAADRLGAHLFIHPGPLPGTRPVPPDDDPERMIRRRAVAFQEQMTAAAVTFEFTAFLDPFPRAVIHLANLGGTLALLADRIAMTAQRMGLPAEMAGRRLRRTVVDTASFGAAGIGLAAATLGADRLLFGTDSPALAIAPQIEGLAAAGLPPAVLADVLAGAALCPAGEIAQS